jgi:major membrane immunogen (membrane-anchored lipoprotein)
MRTTRVDVAGTIPPRLLSDYDRCDRCGAQAYVQVTLHSGQLLFCAHHYQEHETRLRPIATAVLDERDRLHADSSRGSAYSPTSP